MFGNTNSQTLLACHGFRCGLKIQRQLAAGFDQPLTDVTLGDGTSAKGFIAYDLDLDNDGVITAADKDGWRYHQALPYDTRLLRKLKNAEVDAAGYYDLP